MALLTVGDPAPWFTLPSHSNPTYHIDTVGGYRLVLFFMGSSKEERVAIALQEFLHNQPQFATLNIPFFGISIDPDDTYLADEIQNLTYCKFLWDLEHQVSQLYGACEINGKTAQYLPTTYVLNERLQVVGVFPLQTPTHYVSSILSFLQSLPPPEPYRFATRQAPVLLIPNVFDPGLCQQLIHQFETNGGRDSGFMREKDGKTVEIQDYSFKKRRDFNLSDGDPALLEQINALILRRVRPEIAKAFQFDITRFERHLVACYEAENQGFFNRHRDNTTKGTAHRRFAMTLNLNTGEYEGGCLWFPEFGPQLYRPEVGEAVIFSCSLLHEVTPVTQGRRFALLSFFYGDEDAKLRERNRKYLATNDGNQADQTQEEKSSAPPIAASSASKQSLGFQPKSKKKSR